MSNDDLSAKWLRMKGGGGLCALLQTCPGTNADVADAIIQMMLVDVPSWRVECMCCRMAGMRNL